LSDWKVDSGRYASVSDILEVETLVEEDFQALMKALPPEATVFSGVVNMSQLHFLIFDRVFACQMALERSPLFQSRKRDFENDLISGKPALLAQQNPIVVFQVMWIMRWARYLQACQDVLETSIRSRSTKQ
jgi:hypothetical protein